MKYYLLLLFFLIMLTGCKKNEIKITFDDGFNQRVITYDTDISTIKNPFVPLNEGYVFAGWYLDKDYQKEYTFNKVPTRDITLYAKWSTETPGKFFSYQILNNEVILDGLVENRLVDVIIPKKIEGYPVTKLESTFKQNTLVRKVIIPDSVKEIGSLSFLNCTNLENVIIPNGVTKIGEKAFYGCKKLATVELPNSLTHISSYAFAYCSLYYLFIPESVKIIEDYAFINCDRVVILTSSNTIPSGWTKNWDLARDGLNLINPLKKIATYYQVTEIKVYSILFIYIVTNNEVVIIKANENIEEIVLTDFIEGKYVRKIGDYAFMDCKMLKKITLPNSVLSFGDGAFKNCTNLQSINIPNRITELSDYLFFNSGIESINLPDSLTKIGINTFSNCNKLVCVFIPKNVTNIEHYPFEGCGNIKVVCENGSKPAGWTFDSTNLTIYYGYDNFDYNGDLYYTVRDNSISIIRGDLNLQDDYLIPNQINGIEVKIIEDEAFKNCSFLKKVSIPNSVTYIGNSAFKDCKLDEVNIPNQVTFIGREAFLYTKLDSVFIPKSVLIIGRDAFETTVNTNLYCEVQSKPVGWDNDWYGRLANKIKWNSIVPWEE